MFRFKHNYPVHLKKHTLHAKTWSKATLKSHLFQQKQEVDEYV